MADQILDGGGAPVLGGGGEAPPPGDGLDFSTPPPLVGEMADQRPPGNTFQDRALQQVRGTGPHVMGGGKVDKLIGTSGRMNQLMHGQTGPSATSGAQARGQLLGARTARQDPYRDQLHYREDFGTTLTDKVHGQAQNQQAKFSKHISDTNKQLSQYATEIEQNKIKNESDYTKNQQAVESAYQAELSKIPDPTTVRSEYDKWYKGTAHPTWVMSGSGPDNPGEDQGQYKLPVEQLRPFFEDLVKTGAATVIDNRIYMRGRGQEIHDALRQAEVDNKIQFYKNTTPLVEQANRSIYDARDTLSAARSDGLTQAQLAYSAGRAQIAADEGAVQGRREGLQLEVKANQDDLKDIRTSYQQRLGNIDRALSAMIGGNAESRSEAQPVRQIPVRQIG